MGMREEALDVEAIKFTNGWAVCVVLNNGEQLSTGQILHYDSDGEELDPEIDLPDDLEWLVVGETADGHYLTVFVDDYELKDMVN